MLPAGVSSTWPRRPGEVPNTTLPPLQACPTGVTSLDSPPRMLSTHTRSSRVAIRASESMPVKYLKLPTFFLVMVFSSSRQLHGAGHFRAPAAAHPPIDPPRVVDDLAHRRVEAEDAVGDAERVAGVAQHAHAAHQVRPAAPDHQVQRLRAVLAEVLAQRVGHGAEGLEDVGVVALAADDEEHVRLLEPVLEADARHRLHLLV